MGIKTHGLSYSDTYRIWFGMKQRCENKKIRAYPRYGGRGIRVCARWQKFENFLEDMGHRPPGHSIDRRHNSRGYCKSNCRWVVQKVQTCNKDCNRRFRYRGRTQVLSEWSHELKIPYGTLYRRLVIDKWPPRKAFAFQPGEFNAAARIIEWRGKRHNLRQWGRILGMTATTIRCRLNAGFSIEEALGTRPGKLKKHDPAGRLVLLTFRGKTLNLADWAKRRGLKYSTVYKRWKRGKSIGEILSPELKMRAC